MEQEVELGIALVIRTTDPGWWRNLSNIQEAFGDKRKDLVLFRFHSYGRPADRPAEKEFRIEFEEREE